MLAPTIYVLSQFFPDYFLFGLSVQLPTTKPTKRIQTDLNGPSQVVAPETDLFDFSYVVTFTRSSLAESGISISTNVSTLGGMDFGVTNFFAAREATLTAGVFC